MEKIINRLILEFLDKGSTVILLPYFTHQIHPKFAACCTWNIRQSIIRSSFEQVFILSSPLQLCSGIKRFLSLILHSLDDLVPQLSMLACSTVTIDERKISHCFLPRTSIFWNLLHVDTFPSNQISYQQTSINVLLYSRIVDKFFITKLTLKSEKIEKLPYLIINYIFNFTREEELDFLL